MKNTTLKMLQQHQAVAVEETVKAGAAGALLGGGTTSATAIALNNVFDGNKMSDKKVRARNKFDEDEIKAMTKSEVYKEPISKELNRIFKGISSQLKGVLNSTEKESQQLHKEIEDLNKWIADLKKSVASVQEVNKTFGELLRKLENTKADSEDQTVNQSVTSNDGTSV